MKTRPRVVVAVSPRMLRDTLVIALRADGLDVVEECEDCAYDVAIVSGDAAPPTGVETVIRLDDNGGASVLIRGGQERVIDCGSLQELRRLISALDASC